MPNKKKNKKRFVITIAIGAVFLTLLSLYVGFHSGIVHDDRRICTYAGKTTCYFATL